MLVSKDTCCVVGDDARDNDDDDDDVCDDCHDDNDIKFISDSCNVNDGICNAG